MAQKIILVLKDNLVVTKIQGMVTHRQKKRKKIKIKSDINEIVKGGKNQKSKKV